MWSGCLTTHQASTNSCHLVLHGDKLAGRISVELGQAAVAESVSSSVVKCKSLQIHWVIDEDASVNSSKFAIEYALN